MSVSIATTSRRIASATSTPVHALALPGILLSLLILALLFHAIDLTAGTIAKHLALEELELALKTTSGELVTKALSAVQRSREMLQISAGINHSLSHDEQRDSLLRVSIELRSALISGEKRAVKVALQQISHGFLNDNHPLVTSSGQLRNIQHLMQNASDQYQTAIKEGQRLDHKRTELERSLEHLKVRFDLASQDLSQLFSLAQHLRKPVKPFTFYHAGVLANMPVISEIPDNLNDFVALREALSIAGGKVRIEGPDAQQLFQEKISALRLHSIEVQDQYGALNLQREQNAKEHLPARLQLKTARDTLLTVINQLILTLANE